MNDFKKIKKICSFCVSDVHLITMMLPYINREIKKGTKLLVFTQNDLQQELKTILNKINIKEDEKKDIIKIDWKKNNQIDHEEILNIIKDVTKQNNKINIIIKGQNEYIEKVNKIIEKIFNDELIEKDLTIINCYEVMQFNNDISEILDKHHKILNTSGEKEISEVFEGYTRKMA